MKAVCFLVVSLAILFAAMLPWPLSAQVNYPIVLDPLCKTPELVHPPLPAGNPAASTRRMAQRLETILKNYPPDAIPFMSDRVVSGLETKLTMPAQLDETVTLRLLLGIEQTQLGRPDSALNTFAALERLVADNHAMLGEPTRSELRTRKAMAFLRLGEQENCLAMHNPDSCLFPIQPKAYHLLPRGSRAAIELFNAQ